MTYIKTLITAGLLSIASMTAYAATVEEVHPAQTQKNQVPDTTENGNYLETQPVENHDGKAGDAQQNSKAKGKNVTDKPKDGGVKVKPKE